MKGKLLVLTCCASLVALAGLELTGGASCGSFERHGDQGDLAPGENVAASGKIDSSILHIANQDSVGVQVHVRRSSGLSRSALSSMRTTHNDGALRQWITWGGNSSSGYRFTIYVLDKSTGSETQYLYSSSLEIKDIGVEAKDKFFALCESSSGAQVIEKWSHLPKKIQALGAPIEYRLKRVEVFSGAALGVIEMIEIDPYGGFLLMSRVNGDRYISQMDLGSGNQVTDLLSSAAYPEIGGLGISSMGRLEHVDEGLVWILWIDDPNGPMGGVLSDGNGDGLLDGWILYDYATMDVLYPEDTLSLPWVNNFVDYP